MPEVYLTPEELSQLIKFSRQSIYNLIHKNTFIQGEHYFKPTKKKVLFKLSAIQKWIEGAICAGENWPENTEPDLPSPQLEKHSSMRINI